MLFGSLILFKLVQFAELNLQLIHSSDLFLAHKLQNRRWDFQKQPVLREDGLLLKSLFIIIIAYGSSFLGTPNQYCWSVKISKKSPQTVFPRDQLRYCNKAILRLYAMNIKQAHRLSSLSQSNCLLFSSFPLSFSLAFLLS